MVEDTSLLLAEEAPSSGAEDRLPSSGRARRSVQVTVLLAAAAAAAIALRNFGARRAQHGFAPQAVSQQVSTGAAYNSAMPDGQQAVSPPQTSEEFAPLPNDIETKEVYHKIPIYETGHGGEHIKAGPGVKDWMVYFSEDLTPKEIEAILKNVKKDDLKVNHPDGGAPFTIVEGTLANLKKYIKDNDLHGDLFIEEDGDMEVIDEQKVPGQAPANKTSAPVKAPANKSSAPVKAPANKSSTPVKAPANKSSTKALDRRLFLGGWGSDTDNWGLDRIDQRQTGLDGGDYAPKNTGKGVHIYVMDTGIRTSHEAFGGRAIPTLEVLGQDVVECHGDLTCALDSNGHGTHCAGIATAKDYGVAPGANAHAVKIISDDGKGSTSWMARALNWIDLHATRPAVISASLGGRGKSRSQELIVDRVVKNGIIVVVAAGNEGTTENPNACEYTPASIASAITVGSSTKTDDRSAFSNYGNCVDIFAPGSGIISVRHDSDTATVDMDGTSMSCPHVAGASALLLAAGIKPADIDGELRSRATAGKLKDIKFELGTPNELLFVGAAKSSEPGSAPSQSGKCASVGWNVTSGNCTVDQDCCLRSPSFPKKYGNDQTCVITVGSDPGLISVAEFSIEDTFDSLQVNGFKYSGEGGPHNIIPAGEIAWASDKATTGKGFKICLPDFGPDDADACPTESCQKSPWCGIIARFTCPCSFPGCSRALR